MGALITKGNKGDGGDGSGASASYAPGQLGIGPDGVLRDAVVDGILNLENRQLTPDMFAKISTIHHVTKQVVSLSLANNRLTALVFDDLGPGVGVATGSKGAAAAAAAAAAVPPPTGAVGSSTFPLPTVGLRHLNSEPAASFSAGGGGGGGGNSMLGDDPDDDLAQGEREGSTLARPASSGGGGGGSGGGSSSTPAKKLLQAHTVHPLRSSLSWPLLENLDLSGNTDLFNYCGLDSIGATLKSLRLANNAIFKVPGEVWALSNLTKLDLSHNRLLVLPPGISLLTQLNSLKLSHNSLSSSSSTTCIPEEMRFCTRLRRLDLSHNKLKELPVNWRVDKEHQAQRRSVLSARANVQQQQMLLAGSNNASSSSPASPALRAGAGAGLAAGAGAEPPALSSSAGVGVSAFDSSSAQPRRAALKGGAAFGKLEPLGPAVTAAAAVGAAASASASPAPVSVPAAPAASVASSSSSSFHSTPPVPIKYFDPNRISYLQITLLNLSNNQLDSLSPSIGLLRALNSLNLGYNKLRSLPTEVALLSELKYLDLRFNQLPSLLTEICCLPRLSKLCLQNNKISALPYEIRRLKKLTHFFLSSNQLVDLPDVIAEIRNMRVLKLCNNRLLTIPDGIFRLQKLRLLDLSFNRLTYLSPEVCGMPLVEDLRLWGNKMKDIPAPILYSDVKKIIAYLRATERERFVIATQMRGVLQGPRSFSRQSVKSALGPAAAVQSRAGRAQSATRATSQDERYQRFAPLGFYADDAEESGLGHMHPYSSRAGGASARAGSVSTVPTSGTGTGPTGAGAGMSVRRESASDNEDMHGSDDEFTSMFRASAGGSRTASFTNLGLQHSSTEGGGTSGRAGSATVPSSSRRSTTAQSARPGFDRPASGLSASPRENVSHTTIVQPFTNQFHHPLPISLSAIHSGGGASGGAKGGQCSPPAAGSSRLRASPLVSIRDARGRSDGNHRDEDDDSEEDEEEDEELERGLRRQRAGAGGLDGLNSLSRGSNGSDVLTEMVRREWKPVTVLGMGELGSSGSAVAAAAASAAGSRAGSAGGPRASFSTPAHPHHGHGHAHGPNEPAVAAQLMEEWDVQSMAIEKQQGKGTGRAKIGAV